jgi:hypothetical protein
MTVLEFIIQACLALCGFGYLAVSVWLTWRSLRRRSPRAVFLLSAWLFGAPALYIASIAPIVWMDTHFHPNRDGVVRRAFTSYMTPVRLACEYGPASVTDAYWWYCLRLVPDSEDANSVASYRNAGYLVIRLFAGALAIAYAAICLWLTIRIVNRRERWAKWTLSLASLPVVYVAMIGPACWVSSQSGVGAGLVSMVYEPVFELQSSDWQELSTVLVRYERLFAKDGWEVFSIGDEFVWADTDSLWESLQELLRQAAGGDANTAPPEQEPDSDLPD